MKDSLVTKENVSIVQYTDLFLLTSLNVQFSSLLLNLVASGTDQLIKWLFYSDQSRSCDKDVFKWVMHQISTQYQEDIEVTIAVKMD